MDKTNIVIGTIGADAHMIGAWVLTKAFQEAGFGVTFLGAVVPQQEFIDAAVETNAKAILVSSMYGMGIIDCEGLRDKCIEAGLSDIILYAGGTVAAPLELEKNWPEIEKRFEDIGFNRVFPNTVMAEDVIQILSSDLGLSE
ncbi:methylaspartate mutase subunit S [Desulfotignum balticum]|jgi:methylaspartate mutase sigma subunit|uniref:methylaspartate mutase subunit S n=1 Tax=Desulfotignum balticum TaxID=115781 RepID=UPI0004120CC7|nr:methylaspartate mutase subunit S [Desulfotignum balticum]